MKSFKDDGCNGAVTVIGLGKLGSPLAACLAHKGYRVYGVDINPEIVRAVNGGRAPVFEPGLDVMLHGNKERLSAGHSIRDSVLKSDVTFIVVATPSNERGEFSLEYVKSACEEIAKALREKSEWHLVVLTSTVMPGATKDDVVHILEEISGKKCGEKFGLCYSPEFIALGSVISDFLNPDFTLIGESDKRAGDELERLYMHVCDNRPHVARMNFVNAEITKLSVNAFITMKITFGNTLARLCENLKDADVDVVSHALGLDSRIGHKYLKGAVGYGGPCFPRDTTAFSVLAHSVGVAASLAEATEATNRLQISIVANLIATKNPKEGTVSILGLAYKPNTDVVDESQGVLLAKYLVGVGAQVSVYDPEAMNNARKILRDTVSYCNSMEDSINCSDVIVIVTPWRQFTEICPDAVRREGSPRVVIDAWRVLDRNDFSNACDYVGLGLGH